jgi:superoxide dismutase, Fe-Mn family
MGKYTLPELPYAKNALEPHISGQIIELHHGKHHAAYVTNANVALEKLADARSKNDFAAIPALERSLSFNLSGHVMHSIFWQNMKPNGGGEPTGALKVAIDASFGSFAAFKGHFNAAASTVFGSGWAALVYEPLSQQLLITQIYDHQSNTAVAGTPIMVADAWEHAWYLQYQNRKGEFFDALWNVWNWDDISSRLDAAKKNDAHLKGTFTA